MRRAPAFLALAFATTLAATAARADVVLTVESRDLSEDPPRVDTQEIFMTADKLRTGDTDGEGRHFTMIYRGDRNVVWHLDDDEKTWLELDEAALAGLGAQVNQAMEQMKEALAQMPEEQRRQAEAMMKQHMPGAAPSGERVVEVRKTEARERIEGRDCVRHDVLVNGVKHSEVWAASWSDAGIPKDSFDVFKRMAAFYQKLFDANPFLRQAAGDAGLFDGADQVDGFPVLVRTFEDGKPTQEMRFQKAESRRIDAARFEVPAGYEKTTLANE
jgi:hypothetical protein